MKRPTAAHKRVKLGAADGHRTRRAALEADVRALCVERLTEIGFLWEEHVPKTKKLAEATEAERNVIIARNVLRLAEQRDRRPDGRGRPLALRANLVKELDYKLYFGGKDGPGPEQYAYLWLLLRGLVDLSVGRIVEGIDAVGVIEIERENFKKALRDHGQKTPWFPANKHVLVDGKATIEPAADAEKTYEKRDPNGMLLYRYGMKRAKVRRRGLGR